MIIVRTCGSGTDYNDDRLKLLKQMIEYHSHYDLSKKIFKLHDHKGDLSVYWFEMPTDGEKKVVIDAWEFLCECNIQHFLMKITEREI
jgi:hypothetical protein